MRLGKREPYKDAEKGPPKRTTVLSDGTVVEERLNPMQCKKRMVGLDGQTYELSLATGWQYRSIRDRDNKYGQQVLNEKIRKGHLPFNECPLAKGYVVMGKDDRPCRGPKGNGEFPATECCEHMPVIMANRAKAYREEMERRNPRQVSDMERLVDMLLAKHNIAQAPAPAQVAPAKKSRITSDE